MITTCGKLDAYDYGNGSLIIAWGPFGGGAPDSFNIYVNGVLNQNVVASYTADGTWTADSSWPVDTLINQATVTGLQVASYNPSTQSKTTASTYDIKVVAVSGGIEVAASSDLTITVSPTSVMLTTPMRRPFPFPATGMDTEGWGG